MVDFGNNPEMNTMHDDTGNQCNAIFTQGQCMQPGLGPSTLVLILKYNKYRHTGVLVFIYLNNFKSTPLYFTHALYL